VIVTILLVLVGLTAGAAWRARSQDKDAQTVRVGRQADPVTAPDKPPRETEAKPAPAPEQAKQRNGIVVLPDGTPVQARRYESAPTCSNRAGAYRWPA
jgi:hypothetical protein